MACHPHRRNQCISHWYVWPWIAAIKTGIACHNRMRHLFDLSQCKGDAPKPASTPSATALRSSPPIKVMAHSNWPKRAVQNHKLLTAQEACKHSCPTTVMAAQLVLQGNQTQCKRTAHQLCCCWWGRPSGRPKSTAQSNLYYLCLRAPAPCASSVHHAQASNDSSQ